MRLRKYALLAAGAGGGAEAEPDGELAVQLVHMAAPEDGKWSRAKKQCDLWEYVWGASQMLADTLLTAAAHREGLSGVRALELGAGAGLCSLVAGLCGASVLATDGVADAVQLCALSAAANGLADPSAAGPSGVVETAVLDWFKTESVSEAQFDLVIGSDVLFFRGCVTPVAAAITRALKPGGVALVADPCRSSTQDFCEKLAAHGLHVRLRPFNQSRLSALSANETAAETDSFVQHWGSQRGKLIWVTKQRSPDGAEQKGEAGLREAGLREAVAAAVAECCDGPDYEEGEADWNEPEPPAPAHAAAPE